MTDLPEFVQVNKEMAEWIEDASRAAYEPLDEENLGKWAAGVIEQCRSKQKIRLLEPGLGVHYTLDVKDNVRNAIDKALGIELTNRENESDCDGYDEYARFALKRETEEAPWTGTRFNSKTLFEYLEPYSNGVKVIALAEPLGGYE